MKSRALRPLRPLLLLEKIGRVMMDFGIGSFIESIEDHLGRTVAKIILILFVLAAVGLCGSVIWNFLLKPLVELVAGFIHRSAMDTCAAAELAFERALDVALEQKLITPEQATELRDLRGDPTAGLPAT